MKIIDRDYEGLQTSVFLHNHHYSKFTVYLKFYETKVQTKRCKL